MQLVKPSRRRLPKVAYRCGGVTQGGKAPSFPFHSSESSCLIPYGCQRARQHRASSTRGRAHSTVEANSLHSVILVELALLACQNITHSFCNRAVAVVGPRI